MENKKLKDLKFKDIKSINQWLSKAPDENTVCTDCGGKTFCDVAGFDECAWVQQYKDYDLSKPGILIIDDNEGICSFLEDDLEEMDEEEMINMDSYNLFIFSGRDCAYKLLGTLRNKDLNIQKAIIDITYGGSVSTSNGNIKLNGVDVFEVLLELDPNLRYIFYTGNQMNTHIKAIGALMKKYTIITKKKITDNILFKTQFNMDDRRKHIFHALFSI